MKIAKEQLLEELIEGTRQVLNATEKFKELSDPQLNQKPNSRSWSILECIEHLRRYGDYYIPEISLQVSKGKSAGPEQVFRSGWLGNYFVKMMQPKKKANPMKTMDPMDPAGSDLDRKVLDQFTDQQKEFLDLLDKCRKADLIKTKTGVTFSGMLKIRLGDTLRFNVAHNLRHIAQAKRISKEMARI